MLLLPPTFSHFYARSRRCLRAGRGAIPRALLNHLADLLCHAA